MEAGTRLGPYEIREQLGAGGMGEVWLAADSRLGRKVALLVHLVIEGPERWLEARPMDQPVGRVVTGSVGSPRTPTCRPRRATSTPTASGSSAGCRRAVCRRWGRRHGSTWC